MRRGHYGESTRGNLAVGDPAPLGDQGLETHGPVELKEDGLGDIQPGDNPVLLGD